MIFPEVSLEEWLRRYPELKIIASQCENCGSQMKITRSFVENSLQGYLIGGMVNR